MGLLDERVSASKCAVASSRVGGSDAIERAGGTSRRGRLEMAGALGSLAQKGAVFSAPMVEDWPRLDFFCGA